MGKDRTIDLPVEENDDSTVQWPEDYKAALVKNRKKMKMNNHK